MAYPILVISRNEIVSRFKIQEAIDVVEQALANHEKGTDILPDKLIFQVPGGISACMASMLPDLDVLAMKLGQGREENPKRDLPNIISQISLFDPDTGKPLALMDGSWVTGLRTGASAAIAVKYLARSDAKTLGILGAGFQGRHALRAATRVRAFEEIRVYDSFPKTLDSVVAELSQELERTIEPASGPEDLVTHSDVIISCSNTTVPIVQGEWIRPGTHFSCMGADQAWKQELAEGVHARCTIFGDHIDQICHLGEVSQSIEKGLLSRSQIKGTLGQVLTGAIEGRTSAEEITLFDGTGMAIQDAAVARRVYDLAALEGFGVWAEL